MIARRLLAQVHENLQRHPAVVLLGPRQVGKTTLALQLAEARDSVYLDLEDPADLAKLQDPGWFVDQHPDQLIVLDEVQRFPGLFQVLRGRIDRDRREGWRTGRFLLLGSASSALQQQTSESLAGRVAYLELAPFNLLEVGAKQQTNL